MPREVTFKIDISEDATTEQIEEWLEYELGANGSHYREILTLIMYGLRGSK